MERPSELIKYGTLAIPIIVALIVGGVISFLVVYSFYPEKHENINIDGKCYELTGMAHEAFTNLVAENKKNTLLLQLKKIEENDASIPITFNGRISDTENFIIRYHIAVTSKQNVTYYPDIVGSVVQGYVTKMDLQSIIENLTLYDLYTSSKTVAGSIGIQPNKYITSEETKDVTLSQNQLMQNGLREIIAKSDGVKSAECRYNNNR
jgi:hypothetical protein